MPDPVQLLSIIKKAAQLFRATPGRRGMVLELQSGSEVLVAGDLHGNVEHFSRLLKAADLGNHPGRHFVVQEIIHGPYRYHNGADKSHQLLDLLAALKCQFPHQVHVLLGNHELSEWIGRKIGKGDETCNDLFYAGIETAYGEHVDEIYEAYRELFSSMVLAIRTPNRIFLSHSLPRRSQLANFQWANLHKNELSEQDVSFGGSAHSLVWGRDPREETVSAFLEMVDADFAITGHLPCDEGFDTPNSRQLILDAGSEPACYCVVPMDRDIKFEELVQGVRFL